jgi:cellulose synthase/poly-beta-1,6-N-acetylglucosamine synthase-like glycosyltransferase
MSHNEGQNIGRLLGSLLKQTVWRKISTVIVISSGSTDETDDIVRSFSKKHHKVILIRERKRMGKANAVNTFLRITKDQTLVLMGGDLIPQKKALEFMIDHFADPEVGIVGGRPIPVNDKSTFLGFASHLLWDLHHYISLSHPKMGEMIAFRRIFQKISVLSAVDEVNIESLVRGQGFKAMYEPRAVVYNRGPETVSDFIRMRRRIYAGHLTAKHEYSYTVSTLHNIDVIVTLLRHFNFSIISTFYLVGTVILELISRALGYIDYTLKLNNHTIWEIAKTTKKLR